MRQPQEKLNSFSPEVILPGTQPTLVDRRNLVPQVNENGKFAIQNSQ